MFPGRQEGGERLVVAGENHAEHHLLKVRTIVLAVTDRNDARGIAELMRLGWKSMAAQEMRALLTARKLVQSKLLDVQMSLRGLLRGFSA